MSSRDDSCKMLRVGLQVIAPCQRISPAELQAALRGIVVKVSMMGTHLRSLPLGGCLLPPLPAVFSA